MGPTGLPWQVVSGIDHPNRLEFSGALGAVSLHGTRMAQRPSADQKEAQAAAERRRYVPRGEQSMAMNNATRLEAELEFYDETFTDLDLGGTHFAGKQFEACRFEKCKFVKATFLQCRFLDCTFDQCDLSSVSVPHTSLQGVRFKASKLIGIDWTMANVHMGFDPRFDGCALDYSSFSGMDLGGVQLVSCRGREVRLDETTLKGAGLVDVDFGGSTLHRADLRQADLSSVSNLAIDLLSCRLGKTKLSLGTAYDSLSLLGVTVT